MYNINTKNNKDVLNVEKKYMIKLEATLKKYVSIVQSENKLELTNIVYEFIDLIKLIKNKPEPYYYLSLIYKMNNKKNLSNYYFEMFKEFSNDKGRILKLEEKIYSNSNIKA